MTIKYGPNMGQQYPSIYHVENFRYNGFMVEHRKGFAKWTVKEFVRWTNDPGIVVVRGSDNQEHHIPTCQLHTELLATFPEAPELKPLEGKGVLFGSPSKS